MQEFNFFCWLLNYAVGVSFCVDSTSISWTCRKDILLPALHCCPSCFLCTYLILISASASYETESYVRLKYCGQGRQHPFHQEQGVALRANIIQVLRGWSRLSFHMSVTDSPSEHFLLPSFSENLSLCRHGDLWLPHPLGQSVCHMLWRVHQSELLTNAPSLWSAAPRLTALGSHSLVRHARCFP